MDDDEIYRFGYVDPLRIIYDRQRTITRPVGFQKPRQSVVDSGPFRSIRRRFPYPRRPLFENVSYSVHASGVRLSPQFRSVRPNEMNSVVLVDVSFIRART